MKKSLLILALLAALGAGAWGLYRAGVRQGLAQPAPVAAKAERKPLYWHDPMSPAQKFDKPGKSPFMDMQLVPVYADEADGQGTLAVNSRVQQNLGVRTAVVSPGQLALTLAAVGNVGYNERDVTLVQARSNAFVTRLYARAPFDPVSKGQPLAELYVPDWIAVQEEYLSVKRMRGAGVEALQDGALQRMRLAGMSEEQVALVASSASVHPRLTVSAPAGGVIGELSVREGMTVAAGAPLFRINGLSTVWILAELPETAAAQVHPGGEVEVRTAALPGEMFKARVGAVLPEVNGATRTIKARIEVANPGGRLLPGMFAALLFAPKPGRAVLLVPSEALIVTGTRSVVMLAEGEGRFVPVEVETGAEANGQTEVRHGLAAGQKVAVSGQFLIDSEASLKGIATRSAGAAK
ncbi:MAG: efflux RND transporter periplasmic adaptor subunit [Pseudomonadota bacterium]